MYAKSFFENSDCDSITVNPYMGEDSVTPFYSYKDKWVIILALTSNAGAFNFQFIENKATGLKLYEQVIQESQKWGNNENTMYVVGATKTEMLSEIRRLIPEHFLLVPGVGAQGGSLDEVAKHGLNSNCGLLVNSSRNIIYADKSENYAKVAGEKAKEVQMQMEKLLKEANII
jgi:orotidine-5'-phosphate decarboxylase